MRRPTITLGASCIEVLRLLLPLRIPFGRAFDLYAPEATLTLAPDPSTPLHEHEPGQWTLGLSSAQARAVAAGLTPRAP